MSQFYISAPLSDNIKETPEGFLVCESVPITRVGELQYLRSEVPGVDGGSSPIITVERTEADVFDPDTMRSFEGKPLTLQHPSVFVNPSNWRKHAIGVMQNVRRGEGPQAGKLVSDILVYEKDAIDAVKSKRMREVSCGYDAQYVSTGPGRARQTNIRGNHLALVPRGRAGPECAIFDSAPGEPAMSWKQQLKAAITSMGKAVDAAPDDGEEETIDTVRAKLTDTEKKLADANAMIAKFTKERDEAAEAAATAEGEAKKEKATSDALRAELATLKAAPAKVTHDAATIAHAEVLHPGCTKDSALLKVDALKHAATTDEGKAALKAVFGDAAPDYTNATVVDLGFRAVATHVADARARKTAGAGNGVTQPTADALKARQAAIDNFHANFADQSAKLFPAVTL